MNWLDVIREPRERGSGDLGAHHGPRALARVPIATRDTEKILGSAMVVAIVIGALGTLWMRSRTGTPPPTERRCEDLTIQACREHAECTLVYDPVYKDGKVINSGFAPHCARAGGQR